MGLNERYIRAHQFVNGLRSLATGGGMGEVRYEAERRWLLDQGDLKGLIPDFLQLNRSSSEFWGYIKEMSSTYQGRREHLREIFGPLLSHLETGRASPLAAHVSAVLDQESLKEAWAKALERKDSDPGGAVTAARTLVESVCKHILDDLGVQYADRDDMAKLYGAVAKELKLNPDQDIDALLKQILSGCHSVVAGLAGLRNKVGDAHGQGQQRRRAKPRHAELAVNIAGVLSTFLLRTHKERTKD